MLRPDIDYQTLTREMTDTEVLRFIDDDPTTIVLPRDAEGEPTKGGVIGYALAYAIAFGAVGYFILA